MPANRSKGKSLYYRAFRKARAAYALAIHTYDVNNVAPTIAARIALDNANVPEADHQRILEQVRLCVRPAARRILDNAQSAEIADQEF